MTANTDFLIFKYQTDKECYCFQINFIKLISFIKGAYSTPHWAANVRYKIYEMKRLDLIIICSVVLLLPFLTNGCTEKRPEEPDYYKNLFTGDILDTLEFKQFRDSLYSLKFDSKEGDKMVTLHYKKLTNSNDSIIRNFTYSIRVGMEYLVRESSYEKLGTAIPVRNFKTLNGDSIQIGGEQAKPTLISLWFVGCTGCIQEMPQLNQVKAKYKDKVNFVSMTFDKEPSVLKFLSRTDFNFTHIVNVEEYIEQISTSPYPENIFISKQGNIEFIEGGVIREKVEYIEGILEKLLK
jgi:thiol-disulfide isomerase/thioredoxin